MIFISGECSICWSTGRHLDFFTPGPVWRQGCLDGFNLSRYVGNQHMTTYDNIWHPSIHGLYYRWAYSLCNMVFILCYIMLCYITYITWFRHLPLSVFWHTSNVVLDVVSDVVNFSFFFHVNFDVLNLAFFFSHVNFDLVNLAFFFLT